MKNDWSYSTLTKYADALRTESMKSLGLNIPAIPLNTNPDIEIMFLEKLLCVNGKSHIEKAMWAKFNGGTS